jgi:hypothetical protein
MILQAGGINSWHKEKHKALKKAAALSLCINFVKKKTAPTFTSKCSCSQSNLRGY